MFPQYSEATIASGIDALAKELSKRVKIPTFEVITNFHRTHAFIDNSVNQVDSKLNELINQGKKIDSLVITFHGMQKRRIVNKGDDYYSCLLYTSPSPRDGLLSRMPSSA